MRAVASQRKKPQAQALRGVLEKKQAKRQASNNQNLGGSFGSV